MSYRIQYGPHRGFSWRWVAAGLCAGTIIWCMVGLTPVWRHTAEGKGLYETLARYVGEMILGAG